MDPTWTWLLQNTDRITSSVLLMAAVWLFLSGRIIPVGRLDDHKDLVRLLREENAQLRGAVEQGNAALGTIGRQMEETNRVLVRLAEDIDRPAHRGRTP